MLPQTGAARQNCHRFARQMDPNKDPAASNISGTYQMENHRRVYGKAYERGRTALSKREVHAGDAIAVPLHHPSFHTSSE
eukprot:4976-Eustigmatos_ZCMA.PRE.1